MTVNPPRRPSKAPTEPIDPSRPSTKPTSRADSTSGGTSPKRTRDDRDDTHDDTDDAPTVEPNTKRSRKSPPAADDDTSELSDIAEDDESDPDPEDTTPPSPSTESDAKTKHQRALDGIYHYWGFDNLTKAAPERCHKKAVTRDRDWEFGLLYEMYKLSKKTVNRWHGPTGVRKLLEDKLGNDSRFNEAKFVDALKYVEEKLGKEDQRPPGSGEGDLEVRRTGTSGEGGDGDAGHGGKDNGAARNDQSGVDDRSSAKTRRRNYVKQIKECGFHPTELVTADMLKEFKHPDNPEDWEEDVLEQLSEIVIIMITRSLSVEIIRERLHAAWYERTLDEPGQTRMLTTDDTNAVLNWLLEMGESTPPPPSRQDQDVGLDTQFEPPILDQHTLNQIDDLGRQSPTPAQLLLERADLDLLTEIHLHRLAEANLALARSRLAIQNALFHDSPRALGILRAEEAVSEAVCKVEEARVKMNTARTWRWELERRQ